MGLVYKTIVLAFFRSRPQILFARTVFGQQTFKLRASSVFQNNDYSLLSSRSLTLDATKAKNVQNDLTTFQLVKKRVKKETKTIHRKRR